MRGTSGCARGLAGLVAVGSAFPWSAATHREVGLLALERLPVGSRPASREARRAYRAGTAAPDRAGAEGWVPARHHVIHDGDRPEDGAEATVWALEDWLRARRDQRDPAWWFQAGRLAHLVADLCQPLHTAQVPDEGAVHGRFERWVAGLAWEPGAYRSALGGEGAGPTPLTRLAEAGRREYPALMRRLRERDESPALARRARVWRRRAVREVAARLVALGEGAGARRGTGRRGPGYLALAITWWALLRRRSRGGGTLRG